MKKLFVLTIHIEQDYSFEVDLNSDVLGVSSSKETLVEMMKENLEEDYEGDYVIDLGDINETCWYLISKDNDEDDELNSCYQIKEVEVV